MDYYSILGLNKSASQDDIKKAYRKLAAKHHPDRGGNEEEFKRVQEAYEILSNPEQRQLHDNPRSPHGFWFSMGGKNYEWKPRNADVDMSVTVTAYEIFDTLQKDIVAQIEGIPLSRSVTIPAGINNGSVIRFRGLGDSRVQGSAPGDLKLTVFVKCPEGWHKEKLDLHTTLDISVFDAITGCTKIVENLNRKTLQVKIPAGCNADTTLKLAKQGYTNQGKTGDLFVHINLIIPKAETEEQIQSIAQIKYMFYK